MGKTLLSVFLKTAGGIALTALIVAQGYNWANDHVVANLTLLAWALGGAVVAGVIAMAWAYVATPAVTPLGRALREAVQALLGLPIAAALVKVTDANSAIALGDLVVPTVFAVVVAFFVAWLRNVGVVPPSDVKPVGADFVGT